MKDLEAIKNSIDLRDYIALDLGPHESRSRDQYFWCCPFHDESTPSFMVEDDHWYCFGSCQEGGDVFSYVMKRHGMDFKAALEYVSGQERTPFKRTHKPKEEKPRLIYSLSDMKPYEQRLPIVEPYLEQRKVSRMAAIENHVGADKKYWQYRFSDGNVVNTVFNRVSVPTVFGEKVLSLNFRRDEASVNSWLQIHGSNVLELVRTDLELKNQKSEKPKNKIITLEHAKDALFGKRYWKPEGTKDSIWGCDHLAYEMDGLRHYRRISYAIVVESTFDGLTGHSAGYLHISCKPHKSWDFRRIFQNVAMVYILRQNDATGFKYAQDMYEAFGAEKGKVRVMSVPKGFKDENDLAMAGELENFLSGHPYYLKPNLF